MSVEPQRRPAEEQLNFVKPPTTVPAGFYEGPDPPPYADVAEQNRASIITDPLRLREHIVQLVTETIQQPGEIDEETRKRLILERARSICLNPDISNSVAWEHMKILFLDQFSNLPLKQEYETLDMSKPARTAALLESIFKRRRSYYLTAGFKKKAEKQSYERSLATARDFYYPDVWHDTLPYMGSIITLFPDPPKSTRRK